jgi:hypothetical protein
MSSQPFLHDVKRLPRLELAAFVNENVKSLGEDEALAVLDNPHCTAAICQSIAQNPRLIGFYYVRLRLVAHRHTPQAHAAKLVHYLFWSDLLRLSIDVQVPAPVRRSIETQLLVNLAKLSLGERINAAKRCSHALVRALLFDPDPKVFAALLVNQRVREDDLLLVASSRRATPEQLRLIGDDRRWSYRYAIRKALVLNPLTPRATAASQLRYLTPADLRALASKPDLSVYLRRCIERLQSLPHASQPSSRR